jgi:hypothetical protein
VNVVNKKILLTVLALATVLLATPLVSAKPTSAANNPKSISFVWHSEGGHSEPVAGELKVNPPWAEPDSPDVKVTHDQAVWYLNPSYDNYVQIGEGSEIPIDAITGYEGYLYVKFTFLSPTYSLANYKVYERIMWENNYIEIMCLERASADFRGPFPVFSASGTFNGHGEIDGQKVQVTGIREGVLQMPIGMILDCTGTIRFLGNAE